MNELENLDNNKKSKFIQGKFIIHGTISIKAYLQEKQLFYEGNEGT